MFEALVKKYGPEPPREDVPATCRQELQPFSIESGAMKGLLRVPANEAIEAILRVAEVSYEDVLLALPKERLRALFTKKDNLSQLESIEVAAPPAACDGGEDPRLRLERFMRKYNPEKLNSIDAILKAYSGNEGKMFEALVKKYGPEPPREDGDAPSLTAAACDGGEDPRLRLERFMRKYNPEKLNSIDAILKAYSGNEGKMFEALVKKYGPAILKAYSGNEGKMFEALVKKYGPEPPREDGDAPSGYSTAGAAAAATVREKITTLQFDAEAVRERLTRFLTKHAPEKLAGVDALVEACQERGVEQMMESLVATYGPEPVGDRTGCDDGEEVKGNGRTAEASIGEERQQLAAWLLAIGKDAKTVCHTIMTKEQLLRLTKSTFGDYENRLRRLFVRHAPSRLAEVQQLLAAHDGLEDELLAYFSRELGPEPARTAPTALLHLVSR
ncbi:hypothetical protein DQ04_14621020, partial [Trypanosoma grayi]|uniref:hypothetical protein n=1 Tax=Trypanosoma grayi TaxID=71804 RepID=UPI0004F4A636